MSDPHHLVIQPSDEGSLDCTLTCPLPQEDILKACALLVECGCPDDGGGDTGTRCPQAPDSLSDADAEHRYSTGGVMGTRRPGCWLVEHEHTLEAVSDLELWPGEYLVTGINDEEGNPVFTLAEDQGGNHA